MPKFGVILHGREITLPFGKSTVIGFYTTRYVSASTPEIADAMARDMVARDWKAEQLAEHPDAGVPILEADTVWQLSWFKALTHRRAGSGYTFYSEES